jgi:hypothetical protein
VVPKLSDKKSLGDLLTELETNPKRRRSAGGCICARWLETVDEETVERMYKAFGGQKILVDMSNYFFAIKEVYPEIPLQRTTFYNHFRKKCSCYKQEKELN